MLEEGGSICSRCETFQWECREYNCKAMTRWQWSFWSGSWSSIWKGLFIILWLFRSLFYCPFLFEIAVGDAAGRKASPVRLEYPPPLSAVRSCSASLSTALGFRYYLSLSDANQVLPACKNYTLLPQLGIITVQKFLKSATSQPKNMTNKVYKKEQIRHNVTELLQHATPGAAQV